MIDKKLLQSVWSFDDNSPFTLIHPDGIRGVFSKEEIDQIFELAQKLVA